MPSENSFSAPYSSAVNTVALLRHLRTHGLPEKITPTALKSIGVNAGMIARLVAAFKFLGIIDDKRDLTETAARIKNASDEEYPQVLAEIVRGAYPDAFNAASETNTELENIAPVFPNYVPANQRRQQIALFIGLCKESGLIEGTPIIVKTAKPTRKSATKTTAAAPRAPRKPKAEQASEIAAPAAQPAQPVAPVEPAVPAKIADYDILRSLLSALPGDGAWTKERRQRWLGAFTANLDLLIEQSDSQSK